MMDKLEEIMTPRPGSAPAKRQGCTCEKAKPWDKWAIKFPDGSCWDALECPLHDPKDLNQLDMIGREKL